MVQLGGLFVLFFAAVLNVVAAQCDCAGSGPDVLICEYSCTYYIYCQNGAEHRVECPVGEVLDFETANCGRPEDIPPPCGVWRDCSGKADGYYANVDDNCSSYHFCQSGNFVSNNICPTGTVFNERVQACDWPANTCPPCGTASCLR